MSESGTPHGVGEPPTVCELCGTAADDPLDVLTWTLDVHDDGRWEWACPNCSRDHLRDIEARLDLDDA